MKVVFVLVALLTEVETSKVSCGGSSCNVLVVVDVQNDYCKGCGSPSASPWASTGTKDLLPHIAKAILLKKADGTPLWDMLVFTKDALAENQVCQDVNGNGKSDDATEIDGKWICIGNSSLIANTYGWNNPDALIDAREESNVPSIVHTKSTDDWMTTLDPETAYDGKWKYDVVLADSATHYTLKEKLTRDLSSELGKTNLVVTGVETNRCVMKGAVHAVLEGYNVIVLTDAIFGPTEADRWVTEGDDANAPALDCGTDGTFTVKCKEDLYLGYKGGPTSAMAIQYMEKAGCELSTVDAITDKLEPTSSTEKPTDLQVSSAPLFTGLATTRCALILFLLPFLA